MAGGLVRRRRKVTMKPLVDNGWTIHETWKANGRFIEAHTPLSIQGESGRWFFKRAVTNREGLTWVDVTRGGRTRSFMVDRIKTVHRRTS